LNSGNALPKHRMVGNQVRQGLMMLNNEEIVRELYAAAEGSGKDIAKFVSFFSDEGYMCDMPSGNDDDSDKNEENEHEPQEERVSTVTTR
jgi:hypothetical protein